MYFVNVAGFQFSVNKIRFSDIIMSVNKISREGMPMSLTFEQVDKIFKEYELMPHMLEDGKRTEYSFQYKKSHTGKQNVATNVSPLMNGGVRGYIYVGYLEEFKFKKDSPAGYQYIKSAREHIKINDMSAQELRGYLDRIVKYYE